MPTPEREIELWAAQLVKRAPGKAAKTAAVRLADDSPGLRAMGAAIQTALDNAVRCRRCGRRLTDPVSIERGVGSECWKEVAA